MKEYVELIKHRGRSSGRIKLTPADIYFMMKCLVPGIGPKKAAMIARDAYLGEKLLGYKTVVELLIEKLRSEGIDVELADSHHTIPFIDVHIRDIVSKILRYGSESVESWEAMVELYYLSTMAFSDNPGIADLVLWTISREYCGKKRNGCRHCPMREFCLARARS